MWNFLKNPFTDKAAKPARKSAQKEMEAQKKTSEPSLAPRTEPRTDKKDTRESARSEATHGRGATNLGAGFGVFVKPLISEKTARLGTHDTYAFSVHVRANKIEITKAFTKMYGVEPTSVQIANMPARATYFRRIPGAKSGWKKAYIRVPKGSTIAVYEGV
ncbi:MAG: 50S ribosomal protein L23 [Patescibacteria group bacterium]